MLRIGISAAAANAVGRPGNVLTGLPRDNALKDGGGLIYTC